MSLDFIRAALIKQGYLVPLPGTPCPLFMPPSFSLHGVNYFNSLKKINYRIKVEFYFNKCEHDSINKLVFAFSLTVLFTQLVSSLSYSLKSSALSLLVSNWLHLKNKMTR